MTTSKATMCFVVFLLARLCVSACSKESEDEESQEDAGSNSDTDSDADSDSDTDSDADGDSDAETDSGADIDSDTDADSDGDTDTGPDSDAGTDTDTDTDTDSLECPVEGDLGAGQQTIQLAFEGTNRKYIVVVPAIYDPAKPTAMVVNIHGLMETAAIQITWSNMNPTAEAQGFIAVYPQGTSNSWNAGSCCGAAASTNVNDVGFLRAVVEDVSTKLCVDSKRVYCTGMSNGGYMTHRLACEANDIFAAFAPVSGAMGISDCTPGRPVPILGFHGDSDSLVAYSSGKAAIDQWMTDNGCSGAISNTETYNESHCDFYEDCNDGATVGLCTMIPMGHCWPGGGENLCAISGVGPYNNDINANEYMWEFFENFTLP